MVFLQEYLRKRKEAFSADFTQDELHNVMTQLYFNIRKFLVWMEKHGEISEKLIGQLDNQNSLQPAILSNDQLSILKENLINMNRPDIYLIEDSCDTITITPETDVSTCSFYSSHIITAMGSGGILMVNNIKHLNRLDNFGIFQ